MAEKERIEFIDLMKGITIILVVAFHYCVYASPIIDGMLLNVRMPVYIFLSGLFFSTYGSFKRLVVKKINRYILPIILFSPIFLIIYSSSLPYASIPQFKSDVYHVITTLDLTHANPSLWFLKMLFMLAILCYGFEYITCNYSCKIKITIAIVVPGIWYYINPIIIPHYLGQEPWALALIHSTLSPAIVFFQIYYIAYLLRPIITKESHNKVILSAILPFALILLYLCHEEPVYFGRGLCGENYLKMLLANASGIYVIFYISYLLKKVTYVSYMGRYSLVVLCTHYIIYIILTACFNMTNVYVNLAIILVISPILIYVLTRYLPHFTAQKELIKVGENGKIRISFSN